MIYDCGGPTVDGRNLAPLKGWLKPYKSWNKPSIMQLVQDFATIHSSYISCCENPIAIAGLTHTVAI